MYCISHIGLVPENPNFRFIFSRSGASKRQGLMLSKAVGTKGRHESHGHGTMEPRGLTRWWLNQPN